MPGPTGSSTSLTDCLTALKNLVTATNNAARQALAIAGSQVYAGITGATGAQVSIGPGRLVNVSVTTAGTGVGVIFDAVGASASAKPIYVIPAAVGLYVVNMPYSLGLLVGPGVSQVVAVSYSPGAATGAQ